MPQTGSGFRLGGKLFIFGRYDGQLEFLEQYVPAEHGGLEETTVEVSDIDGFYTMEP